MASLNNMYMKGIDGINPNEKVTIWNSKEDTSVHMHDFVEIVYFSHGVGTHYLGDRMYHVFPGCVCVINVNEKHYYSAERSYCDNLEVRNLIFYPEFLGCNSDNFLSEFARKKLGKELGDSVTYFQLMNDQDKEIEKCYNLIEKELEMKKENYLEVIKCLMETILLLLISERGNSVESKKVSKSFLKIDASMEFMGQDVKNIPLMKDIAKTYGFTPEYYSKLFREYTGKSYAQFALELKCNAAERLLLETDYTNDVIAEMCGFSTSKIFYRKFKEEKGLTPKAYRQQNPRRK